MRSFLIVVFCLQFLFLIPVHSQNTDSIIRALDSSSKELQKVTKHLQKWEDSQRKAEMERFNENNNKVLTEFLADRKKREEKENRQTIIYIGLGVAFLTILMIGVTRRRKKQDTQT